LPQWYNEKGYIDTDMLPYGDDKLINNVKIFAKDSCFFKPYYSSETKAYEREFKNITIIGNGDITLGNMDIEGGFLFAPFGKVSFDGASLRA